MGVSCISKTSKPQKYKKDDTKDNSLYSSSVKGLDQNNLNNICPQINYHIYSYLPKIYKQSGNYIMPLTFIINKQYRYSQIKQFKSQPTLSMIWNHDYKNINQIKNKKWYQCTILDREFYQNQKNTIIINSNSFVLQQEKDIQQSNFTQQLINLQNQYKIISISFKINEKNQFLLYGCKKISKNTIDFTYIVNQERRKRGKTIASTFSTSFFNGIAILNQIQTFNTKQQQFLSKLFSIKPTFKIQSIMIFQQNEIQTKNIIISQNYSLQTYFQISSFIKCHYKSFWKTDIYLLKKIVNNCNLHAFLSVQFLKCIIDSLQRQFLQLGKPMTHIKQKIISQFLLFQQTIIKQILCYYQIFMILKGDNGKQMNNTLIIQSMVSQSKMIIDGIYYQFGLQINQKQHQYKNISCYFLKNTLFNQNYKIINFIKKHVLPFNHKLIYFYHHSIQEFCNNQINSQELISKYQNIKKNLSVSSTNDSLRYTQDKIYHEDFLFRLQLIKHYKLYIQKKGIQLRQNFNTIQQKLEKLQFITTQSLLVFYILSAITKNSESIQNINPQQNYYVKALELSFKMYGDPRTNRDFIKTIKQQNWIILLLQNYCGILQLQNQKKQLNFFSNLIQCLKIDLINHLPSLSTQLKQQSYKINLQIMLSFIPLLRYSGVLYKRQDVWQNLKEDSISVNSQSFASSISKKSSKIYNKVNQWELTFKLSSSQSLIIWGQGQPMNPHVLPATKNYQVLAAASGNYHVVFITQDGLHGWGENQSGQLGLQNKQKIYLKNCVQIAKFAIDRFKDKFSISCGNQHTALLLNGQLFMWGQKQGGILGGHGFLFDLVSCGGLHTLGLKKGIVYSWGRGQGGQLGHSLDKLKQKKRQQTTQYYIDSPLQISGIKQKAIKITCGDAHSIVLTQSGKVYVFGFSYQGQLGLGITGQSEYYQIFEPTQLTILKLPIIDIWAGPTSTFFKTCTQQVYACGINDYLQLGVDRVLRVFQKKKYLNRTVEFNKRKIGEQQFSYPRKLDIFSHGQMHLDELICGQNHCLAKVHYQTNQKMIMGWGFNKHYQVDIQSGQITAPKTLDSFYGLNIRELCCGSNFSLATIGEIKGSLRQLKQKIKYLSQLIIGNWDIQQ